MDAAACAAELPKAKIKTVHFVERGGLRARVYTAICGASVHARELELHKHAKPTCGTCVAMLAAFDTEELEVRFGEAGS